MYDLREGVRALTEAANKRRLAQLSDGQLLEVASQVQQFKPEIARVWTADEVKQLFRSR
jgi:hypothetical protein